MRKLFADIAGLGILDSPAVLNHYAENTTGIGFAPALVLKPQTAQQLQAVVAIASKHQLPLYPVSQGKNWGLGSRALPEAGAISVDLGDMQQIRHFNPQTGRVVVQPGVTFLQLANFLQASQSAWQASVIGGSPEASVLANALERGDGIGRMGDRAASIVAVEAVLGNGELFSDITELHADAVSASDQTALQVETGPQLSQLFIQSNFAIVSAVEIQLTAKAGRTRFVMAELHSTDDWQQHIVALQRLMQEQLIDPRSISFWNQAKRLARDKRRIECSAEELAASNLCSWHLSWFIQTIEPQLLAAKWSMVSSILGPLEPSLDVFDDVEGQQQIPSLASGHPSFDNIQSLYFESTAEHAQLPLSERHPEQDGCGCIWLCLATEPKPEQLPAQLAAFEACMLAQGFLPNIGMQFVSHSRLHVFIAIIFARGDRQDNAMDSHALACHDSLLAIARDFSMPLVRLGLPSMAKAAQLSEPRRRLLLQLKQSLDPEQVIAPQKHIV
ncbi:MAG: FAD-binding oxidoreductase [Pseudomonadales bacterium]|nr:FAD-binding oxidoreductase [Pseudomonadales bacterium]